MAEDDNCVVGNINCTGVFNSDSEEQVNSNMLSEDEDDNLSGGEISGIVIGVIIFLAILVLLAIRTCSYKSKNIITSLPPDHGVVPLPV